MITALTTLEKEIRLQNAGGAFFIWKETSSEIGRSVNFINNLDFLTPAWEEPFDRHSSYGQKE